MKLASLRSKRRRATILALLLGLLVLCTLVASSLGAVPIPLSNIIKMCLHKIAPFSFTPTWKAAEEIILFYIRMPRVTGAMLVGATLATAGVLFQGLLRNPLADPYIIGTSAGAGLGAIIAMMLPLGFTLLGFGLVPVFAFAGALITVLLVYNVARVGGKTPIVSMLLSGFAVSAMLAAAMSFLITMSSALQPKVHSALGFLMGGIMVSSWSQILIVAPLAVGGILAARAFAFRLNAFSLGEEGAAYVGIDVERDKQLILALGSLLTATAVSISGLIGFVGLVMPHAMRLLFGPDHRLLLPASALSGGAFLVLADLLARILMPLTHQGPGEIPVGVITALIGAPFFIYLIRHTRKEYAF